MSDGRWCRGALGLCDRFALECRSAMEPSIRPGKTAAYMAAWPFLHHAQAQAFSWLGDDDARCQPRCRRGAPTNDARSYSRLRMICRKFLAATQEVQHAPCSVAGETDPLL